MMPRLRHSGCARLACALGRSVRGILHPGLGHTMVVQERQSGFNQTSAAAAVAVALIHAGLLYAVLLPLTAPPRNETRVSIVRIVPRLRVPRPMPPALFTAMAAPAAPYIPPPAIRIQRAVLNFQTTAKRNDEAITGYSRVPGVGSAFQGGRVVPPSPPIYVGEDVPEYPAAYRNSGLRAFVSVECIVQPDGRTNNCTLINLRGAAAFGTSVLDWLGNGRVRYRPGTQNGHSVAQEAALKFLFSPTGTGVQ